MGDQNSRVSEEKLSDGDLKIKKCDQKLKMDIQRVTVGDQKRKESVDGGKFNLDTILSELGSFGKYHLLMLFLLAFRDSFLNMCNINYMFIAGTVDYRCHVPECETDLSAFNQTWLQRALPNATAGHCERFRPLVNATDPFQPRGFPFQPHGFPLQPRGFPFQPRGFPFQSRGFSFQPHGFPAPAQNETCPAESFDRNTLVPCDRWVYADNNTIVAEFELGCQDWKPTTLGTAHNAGLIVSLILSGLISDRYGRKTIIVGTPLVVGIIGLSKSFSVNYWMLIILEFIEAAFGYGNASLVLSLECVSQNHRVVFACILDMLSNFGTAFFGLIAWQVPYWRHLLRVIYAPLLVVVFYIFLVDEGVRWLLAKGKREEAIRILNKVAKFNNVKLSTAAKDMMEKITVPAQVMEEKPKEKSQLPLLQSLKSRSIVFRLISCSFCNMCAAFIYYGILVNSTHLSGNKYLNYSLLMLVAIPTRLITALTLNRFGRKIPMAISFFLCAVFIVSSAFAPKDLQWLSITLYLLSKMAISFGFYTLLVYTLEVFPTCARNSLTNICCMVGRLGSVLAPQTPLLTSYMPALPYLILGSVALMAGSLILFMPETSNSKLPDDVDEVENADELEHNAEKETPQNNFNDKETNPV